MAAEGLGVPHLIGRGIPEEDGKGFGGYAEYNNFSFEMLNCAQVILVSRYNGEEDFSHTALTFPIGEQKGTAVMNFNPFKI